MFTHIKLILNFDHFEAPGTQVVNYLDCQHFHALMNFYIYQANSDVPWLSAFVHESMNKISVYINFHNHIILIIPYSYMSV